MTIRAFLQRLLGRLAAYAKRRSQKRDPFLAQQQTASQTLDTLPNIDSQKANTREADPQEVASQQPDLQKEIRATRKFSIAEAIGREGGRFMKGESTIPRPLRATTEISQFITHHLSDPTSAFATTLHTWVSGDLRVSRQLDTPLVAFAQVVESTLGEPTIFCEFARQVAIAQSQLTGDRPYFQQPDQPPHPEADYTHESIRAELLDLLQQLERQSLRNDLADCR